MQQRTVDPKALRRVERRLLMAGSVEAPRPCVRCKQRMTLPVLSQADAQGLVKWMYLGVPVQVALPHWSAEMREVLISGTHPRCWREMFAGSEDDE